VTGVIGIGGFGPGQAERRFLMAPDQNPAISGTVTPDLNQGSVWPIFFPAGNITVANPVNATHGDVLVLILTQDGVGARLVTWGAKYRKALTLSVAANAVDCVSFVYELVRDRWLQLGAGALALS